MILKLYYIPKEMKNFMSLNAITPGIGLLKLKLLTMNFCATKGGGMGTETQ